WWTSSGPQQEALTHCGTGLPSDHTSCAWHWPQYNRNATTAIRAVISASSAHEPHGDALLDCESPSLMGVTMLDSFQGETKTPLTICTTSRGRRSDCAHSVSQRRP